MKAPNWGNDLLDEGSPKCQVLVLGRFPTKGFQGSADVQMLNQGKERNTLPTYQPL